MFQNIKSGTEEEIYEEEVELNKKYRIIQILKENFSLQNLIIYILSFMLSLIGGVNSSIFMSVSPFSYAIIAATMGAKIPAAVVCIVTLIGTGIKFGGNGLLFYFLTLLIFLAFILIKRPKEQENRNEKVKLGSYMAIAILIVQMVKMMFRGFLLYDLLYNIMISIITYAMYKVFVNALVVYKNLGIKKVFAQEEVMGASLLLAIAVSALGDLSVFGFSIRNILSILIVLAMGWKNGMLVGGTTGITIGTVVGILNSQSPIMLAAYAISGLAAGLLNKLGRIGVIVGFIIGNIILSYVANGNTIEIIKFQEILIAALGLLAIPKSYKIEISNIISDEKLLPETTTRTLEENKETIDKIESMSNTISQMAKEYENVAATVVTDEEIENQEKQNKVLFEDELLSNLENKEENLLYEDLYNNVENILDDIFEVLNTKEVITKKDIVQILANHNNYIMGFSKDAKDEDYIAQNDIDEIVRTINSSYRISKLNFVWKKKLDENKKTMSSQLNSVSEALSNLADQITKEEVDEYKNQKEEIRKLLQEKEIELKDITIKEEQGKYTVNVYTGICDSIDGKECSVKKVLRILNKVLKTKLVLQKQKCGLRLNDNTCVYMFTSEDNFSLQVGIAKTKKSDSIISGDTTLQTRLEDGKYLLAISDGMGSGPDARKSSKIAIKMLERMLQSGFNNDTALKLINTTISANTDEDMYATLDVSIIDLFKGNMKFIKNGACPTFIKRKEQVQILKSVTLPTGILNNIDLVEYNYDLQDGDIILMCSDGIIESTKTYMRKELWIQEFLEEIETEDAQRIADLVLAEAIDNDFGKEKDDMTVITYKVSKKQN